MPNEQFAEQFFLRCLDRGLIVRHVKSFGIPEGIRINSGSDDDTEFALKVIADVYPKLKEEFSQGNVIKNEACIIHQPE